MILTVFFILVFMGYMINDSYKIVPLYTMEDSYSLYNSLDIDLKYYINNFYVDLHNAINSKDKDFLNKYVDEHLINYLNVNQFNNTKIQSILLEEYRDTFIIKYYGVATHSNQREIIINDNYKFKLFADNSLRLIDIESC